jgi:hypothetical protein
MLDGLTALGLVASIVQLVDFTSKLVSKSREIGQHGNTATNTDLNIIADDLEIASQKLKESLVLDKNSGTVVGSQDEV